MVPNASYSMFLSLTTDPRYLVASKFHAQLSKIHADCSLFRNIVVSSVKANTKDSKRLFSRNPHTHRLREPMSAPNPPLTATEKP